MHSVFDHFSFQWWGIEINNSYGNIEATKTKYICQTEMCTLGKNVLNATMDGKREEAIGMSLLYRTLRPDQRKWAGRCGDQDIVKLGDGENIYCEDDRNEIWNVIFLFPSPFVICSKVHVISSDKAWFDGWKRSLINLMPQVCHQVADWKAISGSESYI